MDEIYQIKNVLNIIISNDHDYIHVVESNENVLRYFFLTQVEKTGKIEHRYNIYERLAKKYKNIKSLGTDDFKMISRYYQFFHSLIGDQSDGFKSIVNRKSLTHWNKVLKKDEFKDLNLDIYDLRKRVLTKDFRPDLLQDENNLSSWIKRFLVVDFYFFSLWILTNILGKENLPKLHQEFYDLSIKYLEMGQREIIKMNSEILKPILFDQDKIISRTSAKNILDYFKIRNSHVFSENLWYD